MDKQSLEAVKDIIVASIENYEPIQNVEPQEYCDLITQLIADVANAINKLSE
jgi:hypothetical protein